jgi:hypothetical protein
MKNKNRFFIAIMLVFAVFLTACSDSGDTGVVNEGELVKLNEAIVELQEENEELLSANEELELEIENNTNNQEVPSQINTQSLINTGYSVMDLIKNKDMAGLSTYVDPSQGLYFVPLIHINTTFDQKFTATEVAMLDQDATIYDWGYYYGGPPETSIMMDFNEYYDEFIYDKDYINASSIGVNTVISWGLIIDNIEEFPNAEYLEFYIQGAEHANGFYWQSLKLVFEESAGQLYLIGIVHGQWSDDYGVE